MQYGLALANAGVCADPRILADLAQLAETAGWDAIFVDDYITHHAARDIPTCDPWIALAAMAPRSVLGGPSVAAVQRSGVLGWAFCSPRRHPILCSLFFKEETL